MKITNMDFLEAEFLYMDAITGDFSDSSYTLMSEMKSLLFKFSSIQSYLNIVIIL